MKSSNILVWYFPSANDSYSVRARQAGNVWIKIADYGISQVCTGLTIKVGICKLGGTDGYIAPETLETGLIKEISAEKVISIIPSCSNFYVFIMTSCHDYHFLG